MKKRYKLLRKNLTWTERGILHRIEDGLEPFGRAPKNPEHFRERNDTLRFLEGAGYIEMICGKWQLTKAAKEPARRPDEYTDEENEIIRRHYKELGPAVLAKRFGRSRAAITQHAMRIGASLTYEARRFTPDEVQLIESHYAKVGPSEMAEALGRSLNSVKTKAHKLRAVRAINKNRPTLLHPWRRGRERASS